jgi:MYXO-CTERM domain-containing protein
MTNKMKFRHLTSALLLLAGGISTSSAAQLLTNGNFETGDFTGWTSNVQAGSSGSRFIDTPGTTSPSSGSATPANAGGGSFYVVTDQGGPGSYSLIQSFTIPSTPSSVILSFEMFNQTSVGSANAGTLDYAGSANQHARVDILSAAALPFETGAGVLQNYYLGNDGAIPRPSYTSYSFDITSLVSTPGTYQLRFAQVDNQGIFQQGIDNVSINFTTAVPEPSAALLGGLALAGMLRRRRPLA